MHQFKKVPLQSATWYNTSHHSNIYFYNFANLAVSGVLLSYFLQTLSPKCHPRGLSRRPAPTATGSPFPRAGSRSPAGQLPRTEHAHRCGGSLQDGEGYCCWCAPPSPLLYSVAGSRGEGRSGREKEYKLNMTNLLHIFWECRILSIEQLNSLYWPSDRY